MKELLTQRLDVCLYGHDYSVFDIETSMTANLVNHNLEKEDIFAGLYEPKCILDVGANIGMVTFLAAKRFPNARIYAVEPHLQNVKHLIMGIERNKLTNVTLIPVAVGMRPKLTKFVMEAGNSGSSSAYPNNLVLFPSDWPKVESEAFTVRLDDIVQALTREHGAIDLMKVDIEGGEFDTLGSFTEWESIDRLHVELHPFCNPIKKSAAKRACEEFEGFLKHYMKGRPVATSQPDWDRDDFRMAEPE